TKGWVLARRIVLIGASGTYYMMRNSLLGALATIALVGVGAVWSGFRQAGRPVTRRLADPRAPALPSALDAALGRVAAVVPAMAAARHRDALRGVVERGLALRAAVESAPADRAALDDELARLF